MNPKQYLEHPKKPQKNLDKSNKQINMPLRRIKETQKQSRHRKSNTWNKISSQHKSYFAYVWKAGQHCEMKVQKWTHQTSAMYDYDMIMHLVATVFLH